MSAVAASPVLRRVTRHGWRAVVVGVLTAAVLVVAPTVARAAPVTPSADAAFASQAYRTTQNYVIRYYPRYMTYFQQSNGVPNRLIGPAGMGPQYGVVVAINDDTLYASAFVDVSQGMQILTIPQAGTVYSLLTLDVFGNTFQTGIKAQTAGTYALVPQGYSGSVPAGTTKIEVPYPTTVFILRADKYSPSGQDLRAQAATFRSNLRLASRSQYVKDPTSGATELLPLATLAYRMKAITDTAATTAPTSFLTYLQTAIAAPSTQPLDASDLQLSQTFDQTFARAKAAAARGNTAPLNAMTQATRDAHALIIDNWLSDTDANGWINPQHVGTWGTDYLDRASLNEFIQYGNDASAAQYFDAFADHNGAPLDGSVVREYEVTFAKDQIPQAQRFWSLTAYIPPGVTLVPNAANKYVVARYTPGLVTNRDGSITIYISPVKPPTAPTANWLPVPRGPFSVMLRVYGPTGNTVSGYVPPIISPYGQF